MTPLPSNAAALEARHRVLEEALAAAEEAREAATWAEALIEDMLWDWRHHMKSEANAERLRQQQAARKEARRVA